MTETDKNTLRNAVRSLAERCDGAVAEDGAGYNATDTAWGHRLAAVPDESWLTRDYIEASERCAKYARQLGYQIPMIAMSKRVVDFVDNGFVIAFPYNPALVSAVRELPMRWFDGAARAWRAPSSQKDAVIAFARKHDFSITEAAEAAIPVAVAATVVVEREVVESRIEVLGDKATIRFEYAPSIVASVKALNDAGWNSKTKTWTVPASPENLIGLHEIALAHGFACDTDLKAKAESVIAAAARNISASSSLNAEIEIPGLGMELHPFQKAGVQYAIRNPRSMNCDVMGLGKTPQAIATALATDSFPTVVVCPATLKLNWQREIGKWAPGRTACVLDGVSNEGLPKADFYIVNYDLLSARSISWVEAWGIEYGRQHYASAATFFIKGKGPKAKPQVPARTVDILATGFSMLVVDEGHYAKNPKAERSIAVAELADKAGRVMWMTGTPILNRPSELINPLKVLGHLNGLGGWKKFVTRYCAAYQDRFGWKIGGSSNLEELATKLRATCMVRRTKAEVLPELPAKTRSIVPVEITNRKEYERAERDLLSYVSERAAADKDFLETLEGLDSFDREDAIDERSRDAAHRAEAAQHLVLLSNLRRIAALGKLEGAMDWMVNFAESGEKLIVFAHHREVQSVAFKTMSDAGKKSGFAVVRINPDAPKADQMAAVDAFQNDPDTRIIVASLSASSTGWTGTAASNIAFLELAWTPGDLEQAEDRAYGRVNDPHGATAWYLLGANTVDEDNWSLIESKRAVAEGATQKIRPSEMIRAIRKRRKS